MGRGEKGRVGRVDQTRRREGGVEGEEKGVQRRKGRKAERERKGRR